MEFIFRTADNQDITATLQDIPFFCHIEIKVDENLFSSLAVALARLNQFGYLEADAVTKGEEGRDKAHGGWRGSTQIG